MEKLEKLKKRFSVLSIIISIIGAILLIIITSFIKNFEVKLIVLIFMVVAIVGFISLLYYNLVKKPFKLEYVGNVLKEHKSTIRYTYKPNGSIYESLIKNYKLIPSAASFCFRDMIEDEVDSISYKSIDLHATHTQSTGKTTTTITDFKGKVYDISLEGNYCNYILKEEKWKRIPNGYEFLELESIEFNNKFNLYVKDRLEAHKIFTPSLIKKIVQVEKRYNNIMTVVRNDKHLYLLLYNNEDQFEDVNSYNEGIIKEYIKQLNMLQSYLEVFNAK